MVTAAAFVLVGVAGAAVAEAATATEDVDVSVSIAEIDQPGVLAMSVASSSINRLETGLTTSARQFTGTLPTVTVTDTRAPDEIQPGAGWYVLGTATDFTGAAGQPAISAGHLGGLRTCSTVATPAWSQRATP